MGASIRPQSLPFESLPIRYNTETDSEGQCTAGKKRLNKNSVVSRTFRYICHSPVPGTSNDAGNFEICLHTALLDSQWAGITPSGVLRSSILAAVYSGIGRYADGYCVMSDRGSINYVSLPDQTILAFAGGHVKQAEQNLILPELQGTRTFSCFR
jgi:hypothetical protein